MCNPPEEIEPDQLDIQIIIPMSEPTKEILVIETQQDQTLQKLISFILNGWPNDNKDVPLELQHYLTFKEMLAYYDGILFKGHKIIVPKSQVEKILVNCHSGHLGINKTMHRARQLFYWTGLTKDVKTYLYKCSVCQQVQKSNVKEPLLNHEIPNLPWQIVACVLFKHPI